MAGMRLETKGRGDGRGGQHWPRHRNFACAPGRHLALADANEWDLAEWPT
jgi:hypothetical protein